MNQADFKQYADRELVKCQRYKQIWQSATNPPIKSKAAWSLKRFQLQQIHIYSPEPMINLRWLILNVKPAEYIIIWFSNHTWHIRFDYIHE